MGCNCQDPNCQPCGPCGEGVDCPPVPDPVMPRCNDPLPDGTYTNATVTVVGGCIVSLSQGEPPQYSPVIDCCGGGSTGGGEPGPPGPVGPAGHDAVVNIGTVSQTPAGTQPTVYDSNPSPYVATLNFTFPEPGSSSGGGGTTGVTDIASDFKIEDGVVKAIPANWPPAMSFPTVASPSTVSFSMSKDPITGAVTSTLNLTGFEMALKNYVDDAVADAKADLQAQIDSIAADIATIQSTCC